MCLFLNRLFPNNNTAKDLRHQCLNFHTRYPGLLRTIGVCAVVSIALYIIIGYDLNDPIPSNHEEEAHNSHPITPSNIPTADANQVNEVNQGITNRVQMDHEQRESANALNVNYKRDFALNVTTESQRNQDPEALIDGSKGVPIPVTDWGTTYGPLRVVCNVMALYKEIDKFMVIQETWGRFCDKLHFVVDVPPGYDIFENEAKDSPLPEGTIVPIATQNHARTKGIDLFKKSWRILEYLEDHHHGEYDYVLKADLDTWYGVNNFKSYAQYFDPKLSWYMGHTETHPFPGAFNAGGCYGLSVGLVERMVEYFKSPAFEEGGGCSKRREGWAEDTMMNRCVREMGVYPLNTLNEKHQLRFTPFPLRYTQGVPQGDWWYWKHRFEIHPRGKECCEKNMIGLHGYKHVNASDVRKVFEKLDAQYEADKMKDIPVPQKPTTFLFSTDTGKTRLKNKDINYRHH